MILIKFSFFIVKIQEIDYCIILIKKHTLQAQTMQSTRSAPDLNAQEKMTYKQTLFYKGFLKKNM